MNLHSSKILRITNATPAGRNIHNITIKTRTMVAYRYSPITAIIADREFAAVGSTTSVHDVNIPVIKMIETNSNTSLQYLYILTILII